MALIDFVRESNFIEGIVRDPTSEEVEAAERFMRQFEISVSHLSEFQAVVAPGHPLRDQEGMNVQVGAHIAPAGGPNIPRVLAAIVATANRNGDPWKTHVKFEMLHPYMDGNGRTGRMLWAWQMYASGRNPFGLGFLHRFYYQTLSAQR